MIFNKLTTRATTEEPVFISRRQWEDAYYIPEDVRNRIVIVDFKEEDNDNRAEDTKSN